MYEYGVEGLYYYIILYFKYFNELKTWNVGSRKSLLSRITIMHIYNVYK